MEMTKMTIKFHGDQGRLFYASHIDFTSQQENAQNNSFMVPIPANPKGIYVRSDAASAIIDALKTLIPENLKGEEKCKLSIVQNGTYLRLTQKVEKEIMERAQGGTIGISMVNPYLFENVSGNLYKAKNPEEDIQIHAKVAISYAEFIDEWAKKIEEESGWVVYKLDNVYSKV
jgi:hypothetical protein